MQIGGIEALSYTHLDYYYSRIMTTIYTQLMLGRFVWDKSLPCVSPR